MITAGNSSQISDGASAVLIMSEEKAAELGLTPRARFHSFSVAGTDPVTMLKGPIPATKKILARSASSRVLVLTAIGSMPISRNCGSSDWSSWSCFLQSGQ